MEILMKIFNLLGVIVVSGYILPLSVVIGWSIGKDGFANTYRKVINFNKEFKITRLEVIDETGRAYVNNNCKIELSYQDEGRTLKIFVSK